MPIHRSVIDQLDPVSATQVACVLPVIQIVPMLVDAQTRGTDPIAVGSIKYARRGVVCPSSFLKIIISLS